MEASSISVAAAQGARPAGFPAPWSPEEDATLLRRYNEGVTVEALQEELGRSRGAVRTRLRRLGVELPLPDFIVRARSLYPNSFKPWTDEERSRLREMYMAREKLKDISDTLGRAVTAIAKELEKENL